MEDERGSIHVGLLLSLLTVFVIVAIGLGIGTFVLIERQDDAIRAARHAEYRICQRQMINRAIMDTDKHSDERKLPLYDCRPNLNGHPARRLTLAQATAWGRHVEATPEDQLP